MHSTRFTKQSGIYYTYNNPYGCKPFWRHVDMNDGEARQVGPMYNTKAELLADHENYLNRAGWMNEQ